ncbi:MAG: gliding motility-associated ABC transporter ATP-binding subunit GldA [Bacteroidetes bacterium]|nr:gliding motility-associated ABC transporter ATP-binding subunit GldA [Bacteroidota bacterium]
MSIEVEGLEKIYGTQKAVDGISFSINQGEIVGFLGPNGAGKSTTMKIITGYLTANAGSVKVCGEKIELDPIAVKKKIGYLPEANPLYPEMYVREYLDFIAGVHGISNKSAAIEKVIALTGLTLESAKKIHQLSKGYKQRIGLAAALIHNPAVLILDEPTSGLDPNQIIEIRNVIKAQGKDKTVLFSSHILQEVEAICDRVIIINKGKIVANDSLANLQKTKKDSYQVRVVFKEPVLASSFAQFQAIDELTAINESTYLIATINPELVRKQLLTLTITENLNIVSLQTEGNSLEDIFRTLTATSV